MRTFLIDGFVAGTWRLEGATLHIQPIRTLPDDDGRALTDEALRLLALLAPDTSKPDIRWHREHLCHKT